MGRISLMSLESQWATCFRLRDQGWRWRIRAWRRGWQGLGNGWVAEMQGWIVEVSKRVKLRNQDLISSFGANSVSNLEMEQLICEILICDWVWSTFLQMFVFGWAKVLLKAKLDIWLAAVCVCLVQGSGWCVAFRGCMFCEMLLDNMLNTHAHSFVKWSLSFKQTSGMLSSYSNHRIYYSVQVLR